MARSQSGACRHGYGFLFLRFNLGLNCKSCDVGWLKLFGFEEDGCVVIGIVVVDNGCGSHDACHHGYVFLFFFIWVYLRSDVGWLIG